MPEIIIKPILYLFRFIPKWMTKWESEKNTYAEAITPYVLAARYSRKGLLNPNQMDFKKIENKLNILADSESVIWLDSDAYDTREDFLSYAQKALLVIKNHGNYRNEIEASETKLYLDNSHDRLLAALMKKKIPPAFNPYEND